MGALCELWRQGSYAEREAVGMNRDRAENGKVLECSRRAGPVLNRDRIYFRLQEHTDSEVSSGETLNMPGFGDQSMDLCICTH